MTERRGYAWIALERPKTDSNVGGALRASHVFGASGVILAAPRFAQFRRESTDTTKAWKHVPVLTADDVFDVLPYGCVPIAVELIDGARPLATFVHPERALYIFGPEDGSVCKRTLARCAHQVVIPSAHCLNLAASVNVVLYDRTAKRAGR